VSATPSLAEAGADVRTMFNRVARRYDAANRLMSAGIDVVWRKKAIARLLEGLGERPRLLDLGAGTLDGALEIARRAPGARIAAADFAIDMLRAGPSPSRGARDPPRVPFRSKPTPPTATTSRTATQPSTARSRRSVSATCAICARGSPSSGGSSARAAGSSSWSFSAPASAASSSISTTRTCCRWSAGR
jgi:hypothetical protein